MAYLDCNSAMPVDSRVVKIMIPVFNERFGNPSSVSYSTGRAAGGLLENARSLVGLAVGMKAPGIIFTSGATEANNLAFMGPRRGLGRPIRMLVGATEHKSVLQTCRALEEDGSTLNMIPVRNDGPIDLDVLDDALTDDTDAVSVMAANSETGVVNPVMEAARRPHEYYVRGWKSGKIWPNFIAMAGRQDGRECVLIYETKGKHLDNSVSEYKKKVLEKLEDAFNCGMVTVRGNRLKGRFQIVFENKFPQIGCKDK